MLKSKRFIVSVLIVGAYLLSACSGAGVAPKSVDNSQSGQPQEVVFTGTVESIGDGQLVINGQQVSVDASVLAGTNIQVGDIVKVEAKVSSDGSVVVLKIEGSGPDDGNVNSNDANSNDDNVNANTNANDNASNDNGNGNDNLNGNVNSNEAPAGPGQEAFGVVEAITTDSITINGVTYSLANFTEFKNIVVVGDQVKIHVIVNPNGTFTIREIEKSAGTGIGGNDNGNSNSNGSDDNSNSNSNGSDDNANHNSNDDSHNDNSSGGNTNSDDHGGSDSNSNNND